MEVRGGGIPQHSFLLATARDINAEHVEDGEVLLLRVQGTALLAMEADLHAVREESLRTALSQNDDPSPSSVLDVVMDPFTKNRVSFTGLRCKILGTFYEDDVDGQKLLEFGADVELLRHRDLPGAKADRRRIVGHRVVPEAHRP